MRESAIHKSVASIRIDSDILDTLKKEAKADNRSLSNYLETLLYRLGYRKDNATTLEALKEAKSGESAGIVDTSSYDSFVSSIFDDEEN